MTTKSSSTSGTYSVESYLSHMRALISMEQLDEQALVTNQLSSRHPKDLERDGLCLTKMVLEETKTGLYGRVLVTFVSSRASSTSSPFSELPSNQFSNRDIVIIRPASLGSISQSTSTYAPTSTSMNPDGSFAGAATSSDLTAVVYSTSATSITLAIDESKKGGQSAASSSTSGVSSASLLSSLSSSSASLLSENATYNIFKTANELTYTLYRRSLDNLQSSLADTSSVAHPALTVLFEGGACVPEQSPSSLRSQFRPFLSLNPPQKEAVLSALAKPPVSLIHGPPGTGKTTAVVELIAQCVARGERVLACAPSNLAADNIVEKLRMDYPTVPDLTMLSLKKDNLNESIHENDSSTIVTHKDEPYFSMIKTTYGKRPCRVIRLGHPARLSAAVLDSSLDARIRDGPSASVASALRKDIDSLRRELRDFAPTRGKGKPYGGASRATKASRSELNRLLRDLRETEVKGAEEAIRAADVVVCTLAGASSQRLQSAAFDVLVIDEAAQALEPACLLPLLSLAYHAKRREKFGEGTQMTSEIGNIPESTYSTATRIAAGLSMGGSAVKTYRPLRSPYVRLVLAGDHKQLPPTVTSERAAAGGLAVTLFQRLALSQSRTGGTKEKGKIEEPEQYEREEIPWWMPSPHASVSDCVTLLNRQYRMHETIMRWASDAFYHGKLVADDSVAKRTLATLPSVHEFTVRNGQSGEKSVLVGGQGENLVNTASAGISSSGTTNPCPTTNTSRQKPKGKGKALKPKRGIAKSKATKPKQSLKSSKQLLEKDLELEDHHDEDEEGEGEGEEEEEEMEYDENSHEHVSQEGENEGKNGDKDVHVQASVIESNQAVSQHTLGDDKKVDDTTVVETESGLLLPFHSLHITDAPTLSLMRSLPVVSHAPWVFFDTSGEVSLEEDGYSASASASASTSTSTSASPMHRGSCSNRGEARLVMKYLSLLTTRLGVLPGQIAVITPYRAQVALLRELLPAPLAGTGGIEIGTVDGFQGREKEVVVFTAVRSNADGVIGFLSDFRRMNVALTRAKRQVAVFASAATFEKAPREKAWFLRNLVDYSSQSGLWCTPDSLDDFSELLVPYSEVARELVVASDRSLTSSRSSKPSKPLKLTRTRELEPEDAVLWASIESSLRAAWTSRVSLAETLLEQSAMAAKGAKSAAEIPTSATFLRTGCVTGLVVAELRFAVGPHLRARAHVLCDDLTARQDAAKSLAASQSKLGKFQILQMPVYQNGSDKDKDSLPFTITNTRAQADFFLLHESEGEENLRGKRRSAMEDGKSIAVVGESTRVLKISIVANIAALTDIHRPSRSQRTKETEQLLSLVENIAGVSAGKNGNVVDTLDDLLSLSEQKKREVNGDGIPSSSSVPTASPVLSNKFNLFSNNQTGEEEAEGEADEEEQAETEEAVETEDEIDNNGERAVQQSPISTTAPSTSVTSTPDISTPILVLVAWGKHRIPIHEPSSLSTLTLSWFTSRVHALTGVLPSAQKLSQRAKMIKTDAELGAAVRKLGSQPNQIVLIGMAKDAPREGPLVDAVAVEPVSFVEASVQTLKNVSLPHSKTAASSSTVAKTNEKAQVQASGSNLLSRLNLPTPPNPAKYAATQKAKLNVKPSPSIKPVNAGMASKAKLDVDRSTVEDIEQIQKEFRIGKCFTNGCKSTLPFGGVKCEFCREQYCSDHMNPLFHGCEDEARAKRRSESQAQLSAMYASRSKVGGTTASSKPLTEAERKKLMDKAKEKLPKPPQNEKKKK